MRGHQKCDCYPHHNYEMHIIISLLIKRMDWLARRFDETRGCRPSSSTESQATRQNRIMLSAEAERFHSVGKEIVVLFFRFGKGSKNIVVFAISPRTPWNFFPFYVQCASTSQCFTHLFQCSMCICYSMVQYLMCTSNGSVLLRKVKERARSFAVASRP